MDFDFKWYAIMMLGMIIAVMVSSRIEDHNESQLVQALVKAGLEECPNKAGRKGDTIWVKNCIEFLNIEKIKEIK